MNESVPGVETVLAELDRKARLTRRRAAWILAALSVCGIVLLAGIFYETRRKLSELADLRQTIDQEKQAVGQLQEQKKELQDEVSKLSAAVLSLAPPSRGPGLNEAPPAQQARAARPIVYIHIADEAQRDQAREVSRALYARNFVVPGAERVSNSPARTVVKFFRADERAVAEQIAEIIQSLGAEARVQGARGFENRVRPGHFEVWFGKEQ